MGKLTSKTVESITKAATPEKTTMATACTSRYPKRRHKLDGRGREMGLGPFPAVTLSQARQLLINSASSVPAPSINTQRPRNSALRRARNAVTPSRKSAVLVAAQKAARSRSKWA